MPLNFYLSMICSLLAFLLPLKLFKIFRKLVQHSVKKVAGFDVLFIVIPDNVLGRKTPDFIYTIPKKDKERLKDPNAYYSTAENAIINYERRIHDNSFGVKLKKFFKNLGQKFKEALQDENEI